MILCSTDTAAAYTFSDISPEYDTIFDKRYTMIGELYAGATSIPHINVKLIHYKKISKKDSTSKIDINNVFVPSLHSLLLLFPDKCDDFAKKMKNFTILPSCLVSFLQQA